ncbi:MAG: cadmium-translocating P-type ATPase, partial [Erysipelotrichaceae bacterium]|nr:cadmium-translocating P-type ATPase [Erysipelotrichaceae bacterium]
MTKKQKRNLTRILIASALLLVFHFVPFPSKTVEFAAYLVPYFLVGYDILRKAFKGILNGQVFDENFLMAIATIGAIALGEYREGVAVMLFYQIGEFFQDYAVRRSRKNIAQLMDIRPDKARVLRGEEETVSPEEVKLGETIVVYVGEKVPIDGIVLTGETMLNTAALTGESRPRTVVPGDEVLSGCINMESPITLKTTKLFGESTVSKILDLIENATSQKSKSENFISKFARIYTPVVCYSALALAILPPLFLYLTGKDPSFSTWIYRALTFLVISCPCALVISIPLSFFGGIGGASNEGILIKGSNYLEKLANTSVVAFDKTGTMTYGIFEVTTIHNSGMSEAELLETAALAEAYSPHPIGVSIVREYGKEPDKERIRSTKEVSGKGIIALIDDDKRVLVGNEKLLADEGVTAEHCHDGGTIVHIAVNGQYKGHIHIGDKIKKTSKETISSLKTLGIEDIYILTGDEEKTAREVGDILGVKNVVSELLPADKYAYVQKLLKNRDEKRSLLFVGDGINDAPVLSLADVGIAMGALGSDAAIEAADIVLMDDDPLKITKAIKVARKCMRIVHENIWFAIGVKVICL